MLSRVSSWASLLLFVLNERTERNPLYQSRQRKGYAIGSVNIIMLIRNIFVGGAAAGKTKRPAEKAKPTARLIDKIVLN